MKNKGGRLRKLSHGECHLLGLDLELDMDLTRFDSWSRDAISEESDNQCSRPPAPVRQQPLQRPLSDVGCLSTAVRPLPFSISPVMDRLYPLRSSASRAKQKSETNHGSGIAGKPCQARDESKRAGHRLE